MGPPSVKMAWEREEQSFILVAAVDRRSFPLLISLMIPVPAPRPVPPLPPSHPLKHRGSRHPSLWIAVDLPAGRGQVSAMCLAAGVANEENRDSDSRRPGKRCSR